MAMTLHFFAPDRAARITGEFIRALPAGSYVIMSVVGGDPELGDELARTYTAAPVCNHGPGGLAEMMGGLELIDPGIVPARQWRAPIHLPGPGRGDVWAAVARKSDGAMSEGWSRAKRAL
jgi:hypothetical protein